MINQLIRIFLWLRKSSFFRVVRRTFMMLMPVAVIGSYFKLLRDCVFSPNSLFYNIFNIQKIIPDQIWDIGSIASEGIVKVTFDIFGIFVAYFAAVYTARLYHKDATMAGVSSIIVIMFIAYLSGFNTSSNNTIKLASKILSINMIFFPLLSGYVVGQVFHWLGKDYHHVKNEHVAIIRQRVLIAFIPTLISIILGVVFGVLIFIFQIKLVNINYVNSLVEGMRNSNNILFIVSATMLASLFWWCGILYPLTGLTANANGGAVIANLNYALRHGSQSNIPYKYLGSSLIQAYGTMGDTCLVLAITVALLLYVRDKEIEPIAKLSIGPTAFGAQYGLAIGLPMILNPVYLLTVVFIPAINELIAASAIKMNLIVPCVYPVLRGTPGILISFFGSNGNWPTLIFTVLLFLFDVLLVIPATIFGQKLNERLVKYDEETESRI